MGLNYQRVRTGAKKLVKDFIGRGGLVGQAESMRVASYVQPVCIISYLDCRPVLLMKDFLSVT